MNAQPETTLTELIRYNNWASQQVLETCQKLGEDQLATPIPGAYGTIRDTLTHMITSEASYVRLLTGSRPQPSFQWEDQPSLAELMTFAAQVGQALVDAVNRVPLTHRLSEEWQGRQLHYNALLVFIQVVNHGIEHRTNITTVLNQKQQNPPGVDGWSYLLAHLGRFEPKRDD